MAHFDGDVSVNAVSKMAIFWVLICAIFTSSQARYVYPRPTIPFELPAKVNVVQQQNAVVDTSDSQESTVSFSLPLEDYNYLKQHKEEYHSSPFNDPQATNAQVSHSSLLQSGKADSSVLQKLEVQSDIVHTDIDTASEHTLIGNQHIISEENLEVTKNLFPQTVHLIHDNHDESPVEIPIISHSVNTVSSQTIAPSTVSQLENHYANEAGRTHNNLGSQTIVPSAVSLLENHYFNEAGSTHNNLGSQTIVPSAVSQLENHYANEAGRTNNNFGQQVTRHIYFHVPPPDLEEPPLVRISEPPKKIYKIIFIKVPAQEASNTARIQQAIYNQIAPVEDKTLIYVLVKKPEPVPVLPPPRPVPSEHEVLFVKYRDNRISADSPDINYLLGKRSVQNKNTVLKPGLANGQH